MTTADDHPLLGAWHVEVTFTQGPRHGEHERLRLTFLPDGVVVGTDTGGQLPPAIGEWTAEGDRFFYWLHAVMSDSAGRPKTIVRAHADGVIAADWETFTLKGGSEFYAGNGELLGTNRADAHATRIEVALDRF